jgi:hypothetical protein
MAFMLDERNEGGKGEIEGIKRNYMIKVESAKPSVKITNPHPAINHGYVPIPKKEFEGMYLKRFIKFSIIFASKSNIFCSAKHEEMLY